MGHVINFYAALLHSYVVNKLIAVIQRCSKGYS